MQKENTENEKFLLGLIMLLKLNVSPGRHVKSVTYYIAKLIIYFIKCATMYLNILLKRFEVL